MSALTPIEVARGAFSAYEQGDRELIERLVAADLVFFSPPDPGIDRVAYFERCWPNAEAIDSFEFARLAELGGGEVLVTYEATRTDGSRFRNTEILTVEAGQIVRVEVYFGWDL